MTLTELNDLIDNEITNAVDDNSITPAIVGGRIKDAAATAISEAVAAAKPYKALVFRLTIDGNGVAKTDLVNDFGAGVVSLSNPSAGVVRINTTEAVFSLSTQLVTPYVYQGVTPYRLLHQLRGNDEMDLKIQQWDGTQTSTPYIYDQVIEIRVYD